MKALVIAEHNNKSYKNVVLNTIEAAKKLSSQVDVLVMGYNCGAVADGLAKCDGVSKVILVEDPMLAKQTAEIMTDTIIEVAKDYEFILFPSSTFGKNLMPRVAALLDISPMTDVIGIDSAEVYERPIYAGNVIAQIKNCEPKKIMTVRGTAFSQCASSGGNAQIIKADFRSSRVESPVVASLVETKSERPELTAARVVVSGGRGLQGKDNFRIIEDLADALGAAVGASRAAVDAGFVPNDYQVGQTGKIVAPELYIAVGISGAIQHLAGMKDSRVIVAINKDPDAPIFQVADYGLVADLFNAVPEMTKKLEKIKKAS